jgi:hypothetical protein
MKKPKKIGKGQFESDNSFDALGDSKKIVGGEFDGYEAQQVEAASKTHLEDDKGEGVAAVLRCFKFGMNPAAFSQYTPTKQELFNSHYKGIELALWKDGLKVVPDINPRITVDSQKMSYEIWVTARPSRGNMLSYDMTPKTLTQIAHGR